MVQELRDQARRVPELDGHLLNGVSESVLQRAFQYWRNVDKNLGGKIESAVRVIVAGGGEGRRI